MASKTSARTLTAPGSPIGNTRLTRNLLLLGIIVGPFYAISGLLLTLGAPGYNLGELGFGSLMITEVGIFQRIGVALCGLMQVGLAIGFYRAIRGKLGLVLAATVAASGTCLALTAVFLPDPLGTLTATGTLNLLASAVGLLLTTASAVTHAVWARRVGARWMYRTGLALAIVIAASFAVGTVAISWPIAEPLLWLSAIAAWAWTAVAAGQTRHWVRSPR